MGFFDEVAEKDARVFRGLFEAVREARTPAERRAASDAYADLDIKLHDEIIQRHGRGYAVFSERTGKFVGWGGPPLTPKP